MAEFTEGAHTGEFIVSEAAGSRSRDSVTIAASQTLVVGKILGQVTTGALSGTAAALGTNTGTGTVDTITVDAGAALGDYSITIIEPAANLGNFVVERPDGVIDGHGTVGTAYNGTINFTLSDATDFVAGDSFRVTVVAADATAQDQYKTLALSATDGTQIPAAILIEAATTGVGETLDRAVIARDAEVNGNLIAYPAGASADEKAAIRADLADLGIIVRI